MIIDKEQAAAALGDPEKLEAFVRSEVDRQRVLLQRADEIKRYRLLMHGTDGAGLAIIPFASYRSKILK